MSNIEAMNSQLQSFLAQQAQGGQPQTWGILGFNFLKDVQVPPMMDLTNLNILGLGKPIQVTILGSFLAGGVFNPKMNRGLMSAIQKAAQQISDMNRQHLNEIVGSMSNASLAQFNASGLPHASHGGHSAGHEL